MIRGKKKVLRWPGVEPGSTAWKATMLTVTPPTLGCADRLTMTLLSPTVVPVHIPWGTTIRLLYGTHYHNTCVNTLTNWYHQLYFHISSIPQEWREGVEKRVSENYKYGSFVHVYTCSFVARLTLKMPYQQS